MELVGIAKISGDFPHGFSGMTQQAFCIFKTAFPEKFLCRHAGGFPDDQRKMIPGVMTRFRRIGNGKQSSRLTVEIIPDRIRQRRIILFPTADIQHTGNEIFHHRLIMIVRHDHGTKGIAEETGRECGFQNGFCRLNDAFCEIACRKMQDRRDIRNISIEFAGIREMCLGITDVVPHPGRENDDIIFLDIEIAIGSLKTATAGEGEICLIIFVCMFFDVCRRFAFRIPPIADPYPECFFDFVVVIVFHVQIRIFIIFECNVYADFIKIKSE